MIAAQDTSITPSTSPSDDVFPLRDGLCLMAIEHFGKFGFDESMIEMSIATDTDVSTLSELFGSIEGLRAACDQYVQKTIQASKTEALTSHDVGSWFTQIAQIDSYAPMMTYIMRTLEAGGDSGRLFLQQMIDNAESYLEEAVRAGTIKPSRDPRGRARFLAMSGGGSFLLYRQLHNNPTDMAAVLSDYGRNMIMPALELYTQGLMADDHFYTALLAGSEKH